MQHSRTIAQYKRQITQWQMADPTKLIHTEAKINSLSGHQNHLQQPRE